MRKTVAAVVVVLLVAFVTQWAVIRYLPALVYSIATRRTNHQYNKWVNAGNTDAKMRRVVMPNPDFVYSALFYDVTGKDITISGALPDSTYASVSFYDDRCQPYYVYNNLDSTHRGKFELTLTNGNEHRANAVSVKTKRGVVICRFLKYTDSSYAQLVPYQKMLSAK